MREEKIKQINQNQNEIKKKLDVENAKRNDLENKAKQLGDRVELTKNENEIEDLIRKIERTTR